MADIRPQIRPRKPIEINENLNWSSLLETLDQLAREAFYDDKLDTDNQTMDSQYSESERE